MAVEERVSELELKHEKLERDIEEALSHPGTDDLFVRDLKKRKLRVKEEIERQRIYTQ